jgi:hypothetical protein
MDLSEGFRYQLQASAEGFIWGIEQVPDSRRAIQPPEDLGEWSVARHVFHLLYYEQTIALPTMKQWLGEACPIPETLDEGLAWDGRRTDTIESMLDEFRRVRAEQINLLEKFDQHVWHTTRETIWGDMTLLWVVSKTYQHTAEHTNDTLRIALFWDFFLNQ